MTDPLTLGALLVAVALFLLFTVWALHGFRRTLMDERGRMAETVRALAFDAMRGASDELVKQSEARLQAQVSAASGDLALRQEAIKGLVAPLGAALTKYEADLKALEATRQGAYASLETTLKAMGEANARLQKETHTLSTALKDTRVRGQWGEIQLQRIVELAGMTEHCTFVTQTTIDGGDGPRRPDMVVRLPAGREIPIDAKAPLGAFREAAEADSDDARRDALGRHAGAMRGHVKDLASKAYWDGFERSPGFVIMFVPMESALAAAVETDPALLEDAIERGVVVATPTTLVAMLRAIAIGWREQAVAENAAKVQEIGAGLHDRLAGLCDHLAAVGRNLDRAVESYNKAVGAYDARVLVQARRFRELGVGGAEVLEAPPQVEAVPRPVRGDPERPSPTRSS